MRALMGPGPDVVTPDPGRPLPPPPGGPRGSVPVTCGGRVYYYRDGLFFVPQAGGYGVVSAPVGVVVPALPGGCETVNVAGRTCFRSPQGAWYEAAQGGFVTIAAPTIPVVPRPVVVPAPVPKPAATVTSSRTVWIVNSNGSKTSVALKAADGGMWVGPNGEYYSEFPTAEQLAPVYGLGKPTAGTPEAPEPEQPQTIWIANPNGSKTPVEVKPLGGGKWKAPKGEVYDSLPTEEQLRPVYGLK